MRDSRIHRKIRFLKGFQKQFKQRTIGNHNPESCFCQMCQVFRHLSLLSPRMRHLIVPKNLGAPGFTENTVFEKVSKCFKSNLNKEPLATTILNPVFVKCVRFLGIFHCYRPECAIWLFPNICEIPRLTEKTFFLKGFQKQFKQRTIGNHNPESNFQMCQVFGHFSLHSPRMCHLIVPKNWGAPGFTEFFFFWKGFKSNLNKEPLATTILNPFFCQMCQVFGHFSLLSPRMCHLIVPKNLRDSRIHRKNVFFERVSKAI